MSAPVWHITASDAAAFTRDVLFSRERTRPVVAVTTNPRFPDASIDPSRLAVDIGSVADIVALETGEATWALSAALPSRLDVYGGAVRIWWPGLSPSSKPEDHPLLFCFTPDEAVTTALRVIGAVRAREGPRPAPAPQRPIRPALPSRPPPVGPVCEAVVTRIEGSRVEVAAGERTGVVSDADVPLERLAADLSLGEALQVRQVPTSVGQPTLFSVRGIIPDAWVRISRSCAVGDVVRGRVCLVGDSYVLVEILPGAALLVPGSEIDWERFARPADVLRVGEHKRVKVLSIDSKLRRGTGSIKQGYSGEPRAPLSPGPGQPAFLDDEAPATAAPDDGNEEGRASLLEEIRSVVADREELIRRLRDANEQVAALRKELRSAKDRAEARDAELLDPLTSDTAFLTAVRVEYARRFDEGSRALRPLQRVRVGREFLTRLRDLEGIDVVKVVEVCAQVACGRAHEVAGRSVHELRAGEAGGPGRARASDGAKAWRCSLQEGTASARRLHWWDIPGKDGRTIEFASVAVHDDLSIPS